MAGAVAAAAVLKAFEPTLTKRLGEFVERAREDLAAAMAPLEERLVNLERGGGDA